MTDKHLNHAPVVSWKPLGPLEKYMAIVNCVVNHPHLSPAAISVFVMLVHRQNPKTGRCDLSVARLMRDTGYKERTVRKAVGELVDSGPIVRHQMRRGSTNHYVILPADEEKLRQILSSRPLQDYAETPAAECRKPLQRNAPKKINEKRKKRAGNSRKNSPLSLKLFESNVVEVFEVIGEGYDEVCGIPIELYYDCYEKRRDGEMSFEQVLKAFAVSLYGEDDAEAVLALRWK